MDPVLFVDDDPYVLSALKRSLAKEYQIDTAEGAGQAIEAMISKTYAAVVSDLKMPGMSGIEILAKVKEISPNTVRILLTGHADLDAAIAAVNEGNIFRLLTKPCNHAIMTTALDAALAQYRLVVAEQELLHETLMGTVNVLVEILSAVQPVAFGRTSRIRLYVQHLAREMQIQLPWEIDAAAALSQLGCISVSDSALKKYCSGEDLSAQELQQVQSHPHVASRLLQTVPRLHAVAEIIERQFQSYAGSVNPSPAGYHIVLGGEMLRVAHDFDRLIRQGLSWEDAVAKMACDSAEYNPDILGALGRMDPEPAGSQVDGNSEAPGKTALCEESVLRTLTEKLLRRLRAETSGTPDGSQRYYRPTAN